MQTDSAPAETPWSPVATAPRARLSLRFVAGLSVSLILHALLLWLLLMPRAEPGSPLPVALSALVVEWQQPQAPRPQPPTPLPPAETTPARSAPQAEAKRAEGAAQASVQAEPDVVQAPTPQRALAEASDAAAASAPEAAPAAASALPAPSTADAYLWDVLAHLRRFQHYPERARQDDLEGTVWLRTRVSRRGVVLRSEVERSSGHAVLDRAATRLIARASPLPLPPQGAYAITDLSVPVEYRLRRE
jgi:protein TonB